MGFRAPGLRVLVVSSGFGGRLDSSASEASGPSVASVRPCRAKTALSSAALTRPLPLRDCIFLEFSTLPCEFR